MKNNNMKKQQTNFQSTKKDHVNIQQEECSTVHSKNKAWVQNTNDLDWTAEPFL